MLFDYVTVEEFRIYWHLLSDMAWIHRRYFVVVVVPKVYITLFLFLLLIIRNAAQLSWCGTIDARNRVDIADNITLIDCVDHLEH